MTVCPWCSFLLWPSVHGVPPCYGRLSTVSPLVMAVCPVFPLLCPSVHGVPPCYGHLFTVFPLVMAICPQCSPCYGRLSTVFPLLSRQDTAPELTGKRELQIKIPPKWGNPKHCMPFTPSKGESLGGLFLSRSLVPHTPSRGKGPGSLELVTDPSGSGR